MPLHRGVHPVSDSKRPRAVWHTIALALIVFVGACSASTLPDVHSLYPTYQEVYPSERTVELNFGKFVALSRDGTTSVIGAPAYDGRGSKGHGRGVFVYESVGGSWQLRQNLFVNDTNAQYGYAGFGASTNMDGSVIAYTSQPEYAYDPQNNTYFYSDGAVYIFIKINPSQWSFIGETFSPTPVCGRDYSGQSLYITAMSYSGSIIATNGYSSDCGILMIERQGTSSAYGIKSVISWSPTIDASEISYGSLAISWDGAFIAGVTIEGTFLLFERNSTGEYDLKTYLSNISFTFGQSLTMSHDVSKFVLGTYEGRGAFFLEYDGVQVTLKQEIWHPADPNYSNDFAVQARIFQQGQRLLLTDTHFANGNGSFFLFQLQNGLWKQYPGNYTIPHPDGTDYTGKNTNSEDSYFGYWADASYDGQVLLVGAYGDRGGIGSAFFFREASQECAPSYSTDINQCASTIRACAQKGIIMKWSGKGCRRNGKILGDGGCQCNNYCGYECASSCKADRQCKWSKSQGCLVKATGKPGVPIPVCT